MGANSDRLNQLIFAQCFAPQWWFPWLSLADSFGVWRIGTLAANLSPGPQNCPCCSTVRPVSYSRSLKHGRPAVVSTVANRSGHAELSDVWPPGTLAGDQYHVYLLFQRGAASVGDLRASLSLALQWTTGHATHRCAAQSDGDVFGAAGVFAAVYECALVRAATTGRIATRQSTGGGMIRVLLVDDQEIVRQGLKALLSLEADLQIVGEVANGREAVAITQKLFTTPNAVEVALMDIRMPVMDGVAATRELLRQYPDLKILVLTTFEDDEQVQQAVAAGAVGYLLQDTPSEEVAQAIRAVHRGYAQFGPGILQKMVVAQLTHPKAEL